MLRVTSIGEQVIGLAMLLEVVACSASKGADAPRSSVAPASSTASAPSNAGDASEDGWRTLITGDWSMAAGTEGYVCARLTVNEDLYVDGFEAIIPLGTHHTLLTTGAPKAADGVSACSAADNGPLGVFGSGVGTARLDFPSGVALKIASGNQLDLNLHLLNAGTSTLTGESGTRVHTVPESEVVHMAEGILAGTLDINLPPAQTTTTIGHCTMSSDVTLFAVAPHMHTLGIHEKVVAERSAGEVVLLDAPYDFNNQSYQLITPVNVAKGDRVRVECTWDNTTDNTVTFGQSTHSEMCFAGIFRYPGDGSALTCVDPPGDQ